MVVELRSLGSISSRQHELLSAAIIASAAAASLLYFSSKRPTTKKRYPPFASAGMLETIQTFVTGRMKDFLIHHFHECGSKMYRIRLPLPGIPMVVVVASVEDCRAIFRDPMTTKPRLLYDAISNFTNAPNVASILKTDQAWFHRRKALNVAFAPKRIQSMNAIAMQVVKTWSDEYLEKAVNGGSDGVSFDVGKELIDVTVAIICQAALEYPTTRQQREALVQDSITPAFEEFSCKEGFNPLRKFATWMLPDRQKAIVGRNNLQQFAFQIMEHYRNNPSPTNETVIDVIMKNTLYKNDQERAADIIMMLFAGHDTTGFTLAFCLLELAKHPQEQERLRQSLPKASEKYSSTEKSADSSWSYLKAVITETMRLHPVVAAAGFRQLGKNYVTKSGDYFLPKGTICFMAQTAVYRDSDVFENAFDFMPSRWMSQEDDKTTNLEDMKRAMFPFALGKRNCVGQALANAELYSVLPYLIQNFEFSLQQEGKISYPATVRLDDCWLRARKLA